MRTNQRGSALVIATIVVLIIAVIGVGLIRISTREVAGASAGQRHQALVACADAARALILSRFHLFGGITPDQVVALDERLDGATGRMRAVGGHVDSDPATTPLVTIRQVETMPPQALESMETASDVTNLLGAAGGAGVGGGRPLKVTVHCQEGDLTSPTSGRQLEIEFGIRWGQ